MKILWLDIGTKMGWAHNANNDFVTYGSWDFTAHNRAERQMKLLHTLDAFLRGLMVDAVGYERPFARGRDATRSLWGMAGIVEAVATQRGFPVIDEEPKSIKKFWTGNGNAKKEDMIKACDRFKTEWAGFPNEHEADAIAGLHYALKHVNKVTK